MQRESFWRYENGLLAILTFSLGFTIFDRVAINLLSPYILIDLHLNNTDLGLMASALSVTLAVSGYFFGTFSDRARNRKGILFVAVVVFSLLSAVSGLAVSLLTMIAARMLMGLTEGPILPLSYAVLAMESSEKRRAFNMGVFANFATCLIGGVVGPIVLTHVANTFGWRVAFFITGVPGLFIAFLIFRFVREPKDRAVSHTEATAPAAAPVLGRRNVWLCLILTCGIYTWLLVTLVFTPIFLVRFVGMPITEMGYISAINGVAGFTLAVGVSWLADRIGRKPTVILFCLVGLLVPIGELWAHNSIALMSFLMFLGWSAIGVSPLVAGTIPSETVGSATVAKTLAIIIGVAEIFGGVLMPIIAGWAADRWGLEAPMWIVLGITAVSAVAACFIEETLPSKVGASAFAVARA